MPHLIDYIRVITKSVITKIFHHNKQDRENRLKKVINSCTPFIYSVKSELETMDTTSPKNINSRPKLFIGASKEANDVVTVITKMLSHEFDVQPWYTIFKSNDFTLQALLDQALLCDFAIMIFSLDDTLLCRKELFQCPRDNVIFELGLFLGLLGKKRAFVLAEEGIKIPTDLNGFTLSQFNLKAAETEFNSLSQTITTLAKQMLDFWESGAFGMLPSTILALNYFNNFLTGIAENIQHKTNTPLNGNTVTLKKFYVVMPTELEEDMTNRYAVYKSTHNLQPHIFPIGHREGPLFVKEFSPGEIIAFDLPTTLSGIRTISKHQFPAEGPKISKEQKLLEARELKNFKMVLKSCIENNSITKAYVEIIDEKND